MDNVKEQERAQLHSTIWKIAEDLRGSVDGWDFKSYVLGILFYRYISENITILIRVNGMLVIQILIMQQSLMKMQKKSEMIW